MSNLNLIDTHVNLSPDAFLRRMQQAFQQPLGGELSDRQTMAVVTGHDENNVVFTNLTTQTEFTMPLDIFLLVPAKGLPVEISRVHHRIFCWLDNRDQEPVQLQIRQ